MPEGCASEHRNSLATGGGYAKGWGCIQIYIPALYIDAYSVEVLCAMVAGSHIAAGA